MMSAKRWVRQVERTVHKRYAPLIAKETCPKKKRGLELARDMEVISVLRRGLRELQKQAAPKGESAQ